MDKTEQKVAHHYGDSNLLERILQALEDDNFDIENLHAGDLAPVEEFHIGGRQATEYAISKLSLQSDQQILDIGCGIGGAARFISNSVGCEVIGIDLTPEYIHCATDLSRRLKLEKLNKFYVGSALNMPFKDQQFDAAITFHVAMNIEDRETLYQETARVLKPGGSLCVYDVMQMSAEPLCYPVPWATSDETSFLKTPAQMHALLLNAGLTVNYEENRAKMALSYFKDKLAAAHTSAIHLPPALGIHLVMKDRPKEKFKNTLTNIEMGRIAPFLMIAKKL